MRVISTSIVVLVFGLQAFGQHKFNVLVGSGIGFYKQGDLKKWQSSVEPQWRDLGLETIDDFPPYIFYTGEISREVINKFTLGLVYRFESTGYKSSYADYSGSIQFHQKLKMHAMGLLLRYDVFKQKKITVAAQLRTYYTKSSVDLLSEIVIAPSAQYYENLKYKSNSWILSPGIDFSYPVMDRITLHATLEYSVDLKGELELDSGSNFGSSGLFFFRPTGSETDWSGARLGVGIAYHF